MSENWKYPFCVIDTETLGSGDQAPITEIACLYIAHENAPRETWHRDIFLTSLSGADVDTLEWRLNNLPELTTGGEGMSIDAALKDLQEFGNQQLSEGNFTARDLTVWERGNGYDSGKLEWRAQQHGIKLPWHFHRVENTRTLIRIAKQLGWEEAGRDESLTHHYALDDCQHDATLIESVFKHLDAIGSRNGKSG